MWKFKEALMCFYSYFLVIENEWTQKTDNTTANNILHYY